MSTERHPWGSQETEMKQKARSHLFVVAGTYSAARLKGRTAKWNEKGITSAVWTWRPLLETGLQYQWKVKKIKQILSSFVGHGYKCLLYSACPLFYMQQYMTGTPPLLQKCYGNHTQYFKSFSSIFHFPLFSGWENRHVSSTKEYVKPSKPSTLTRLKVINSAYVETWWLQFLWAGKLSNCRSGHINYVRCLLSLLTNHTTTDSHSHVTKFDCLVGGTPVIYLLSII